MEPRLFQGGPSSGTLGVDDALMGVVSARACPPRVSWEILAFSCSCLGCVGGRVGVPAWSQGVDLLQLRLAPAWRLRMQLGPAKPPPPTTCGSEAQKGGTRWGLVQQMSRPCTVLLVYLLLMAGA